MTCPNCGGKTNVYAHYRSPELLDEEGREMRRRYRRCSKCGKKYVTIEHFVESLGQGGDRRSNRIRSLYGS